MNTTAPLPLAAAAERLRKKPGRPPLSAEEKKRRSDTRRARVESQLAAIEPRLFDVAGAARYTGLSPWTIRDLVARGSLPRVVIPSGREELRVVRIDRQDLDRLIERWKAGE